MASAFSPIQNHILKKLKNAHELRYSELQLRSIPNDLFNYHLQFLVKKNFVKKTLQGYRLSELGIKHVADPILPEEEINISSLYKVNVITIVSRVHDGKLQILNQMRTSHPSYGKIGVPGGIVRKGELIEEAAMRKLKVETGLTAEFKLVGMERRIMYRDHELFSDVVFPIAYADSYSGQLIDTEYGHNIWVNIDQAIKHESQPYDSIKTIVDVLKAIKNKSIKKQPFLFAETIQSK
jgi:ADP-ribose pyrophosphatase YjhB (NUDIX family)